MHKISILLPTFNRREFLPNALNNIQNQIFKDWKLYIINDGGEDVQDIVDSFNEPRFEYHSKAHGGKAAALNYVLNKVESKYIAYMDDDDEVYPQHLALLYNAAEENKSEFVYSNTKLTILDGNNTILSETVENEDDVDYEAIRFTNKINHKQILHTKNLQLKAGLYDEDLQILIDYDYIRRLTKLVTPFHVKEVTGNHFVRDNSKNGSAITNLWDKDLAAAGMSVLNVFKKSPEDIAALYKSFADCKEKEEVLAETINFCNRLVNEQEKLQIKVAEQAMLIKKLESILAKQ